MKRVHILFSSALFIAAANPLPAELDFAEELFPELGPLMQMASRGGAEFQLSELRVEERQGDLDVAVGRRKPQVRAYARVASAYEMREDIDDRFRGSVNANVTLSQPLYHWGNLERQQAVAENRIALEGVEFAQSGARYFMEIRRAYLQWLLMKERRAILEQSIALSESFVDARRQLVGVGQSSEQEVLEMEARLLENHESQAFVETQINALKGTLRRLVGSGFDAGQLEGRPLSVIEPMTSGEFEILLREANVASGDVMDPAVQRFAVLEEIEETQLAMLDNQNLPKVDFVAGVFTDHLDSANQEDFILRIQYYAGLQVNWSIFDGWQTDGWKRSTLARKRAYALRGQSSKEASRQRVETLLAQLQLNLKQIEARQKREVILGRRMDLVREQAERAQVTGVDRIEGEIDYLEVRQRLMEARVNYLMNAMELGILLGKDPAASFYRNES